MYYVTMRCFYWQNDKDFYSEVYSLVCRLHPVFQGWSLGTRLISGHIMLYIMFIPLISCHQSSMWAAVEGGKGRGKIFATHIIYHRIPALLPQYIDKKNLSYALSIPAAYTVLGPGSPVTFQQFYILSLPLVYMVVLNK